MKKRLPKNICQVGETDGSPKILIEEYTISFLQEIVKKAKDPQIVVFYGDGYEQEGIRYYYLKGIASHRASGNVLNKMDEFYFQTIGKQYFPAWKGIGWYYMEEGDNDILKILQNMREQDFGGVKGYYIYFEKNIEMEDYLLQKKKKERNSAEFAEEKNHKENAAVTDHDIKKKLKKDWNHSWAVKGTFFNNKMPAPIAAVQVLNMVSLCILIICCIIAVTTLNQYDKMKQLEETVTYLEASMEEEKNLPEE